MLPFLILALWLFIPATTWCYDLLIVQSQRSPAYDEVLRGFRAVGKFTEKSIVLTDYIEVDLIRIVREENPTIIVTLGDRALAATKKIRQTPIIALMALSYKGSVADHPSVSGIEIQSPPEKYLSIFTAIKSRKVGVISNSSRSSSYIKNAKSVAAELGIEMIVREVKTSREVSSQLASLAGTVDALWMLPDCVTSSGEAADAHFLFSASHHLPVVTFSSAYLSSGAAISLEFDRYGMGFQGGEMAEALLQGARMSDVPPETPRKTTLKCNPQVLRRLNIKPELAHCRNTE